jgi:NAD(P)-dependent dehydrogenase (short-subunit alcohol dehydrogenase family)
MALQGAFITIADVPVEAGVIAAKEMFSTEGKVQFLVCDVTNYEPQAAAFKSAIECGNGSIDIAVPAQA